MNIKDRISRHPLLKNDEHKEIARIIVRALSGVNLIEAKRILEICKEHIEINSTVNQA